MTVGGAPPPPSMPRAVLDTSVLLSEHRHWLWLFAKLGYYEAVWSTYILGEMVRVRVQQYITHGVPRAEYRRRINNLIHRLSDVMLVADYRKAQTGDLLKDPDDEPILAAALAAHAGFVVSLNTRDFPPGGEVLTVRFLTPRAFLTELESHLPDMNLTQHAEDVGRQLP